MIEESVSKHNQNQISDDDHQITKSQEVLCVCQDPHSKAIGLGLPVGFKIYSRTQCSGLYSFTQLDIKVDRMCLESTNDKYLVLTISNDSIHQSTLRVYSFPKSRENLSEQQLLQTQEPKLHAKSKLRFTIQGVKYWSEIVALVNFQKIYYLDTKTLKPVYVQESAIDNTRALCDIGGSKTSRTLTFVTPEQRPGYVKITYYSQIKAGLNICAHNSKLYHLLITNCGSRVMTCSGKGTFVRIFNSETGEKVQQVEVSKIQQEVQLMQFSELGDWMCLVTAKGRLKVYISTLTKAETRQEWKRNILQLRNPKSILSVFKAIFPSLDNQLSFAQRNLDCSEARKGLIVASMESSYNWEVVYLDKGKGIVKHEVFRMDPLHGGTLEPENSTRVNPE